MVFVIISFFIIPHFFIFAIPFLYFLLFTSYVLIPLTIIDKPTKFPLLGKDEYVVCCYAQGLDKFLIICENLKDMQLLYKKFEQG